MKESSDVTAWTALPKATTSTNNNNNNYRSNNLDSFLINFKS